jgi:magnesium-transporting ATPase (P-type)
MRSLFQPDARLQKSHIGIILAFMTLLATALTLIFHRLSRRSDLRKADRQTGPQHVPPPSGLTAAEAAARLDPDSDQDNIISAQAPYSRQKIVRGTIFSIFNLNLVVLAAIQLLFVRPIDALITLGIIVVNVVANVLQYEISQRRLKEILIETRPQVTVMRDGKARSIDPREIVIGDILTAGRGDQIMADGPLVGHGSLVVDESMLGLDGGGDRKQAGDPLLAGSMCLNGRAAYRADVLGDERRVVRYLRSLPDEGSRLTAIEKILNQVMRVLLVIMILLVAVIILRFLSLDLLRSLDDYVDSIIVILNLAPASLFFMVVLTYVSATADLAKIGALIRQSRSVESLAQLDVLCFAKAGFLTGLGAQLQAVADDDDNSQEVALPRIRQILGDFAHSSDERNQTMRALMANFPGSSRILTESAPFLSAYGWSAVVFHDDELQGLYVLAEPDVIGLDLAGLDSEAVDEDEGKGSSITSSLVSAIRGPFARLRSRNKDETSQVEPVEAEEDTNAQAEREVSAEPEKGHGRFSRWRSRLQGTVSSLVKRGSDQKQEEPADELVEADNVLIFAYNAEARSLNRENGQWRLPHDLTPLCQISFEEQVKPEAREAINLFSTHGVAVKIFAADEPEKTANRLRDAGVSLLEDPQLLTVDGPQLEGLTTAELAEIALTHTLFGALSPQKSADIVRSLREAGNSVGVAGDGVNDVAALRGADLAIVRKDSSPAVLGIGDIVLLEEGETTLSKVLEKGQRIVKGLVDILKLYLTQILYLLLLIIAIPLLASGFPYTSQQAGLIALITLTIPALALTLFASTGKLPRAKLTRILGNFIVPAALSIAILGFLVYVLTLRQSEAIPYAQNVLTYALVAMGLLLVLTIKPPVHVQWGSLPTLGDIRPTIIVILSVIVFILIARIPFFSELFGIVPLQQPADFALVIGAALIWIITVQIFWRLFPVVRSVSSTVSDTVSSDLRMVGGEKTSNPFI